jgi:hypothetical protein
VTLRLLAQGLHFEKQRLGALGVETGTHSTVNTAASRSSLPLGLSKQAPGRCGMHRLFLESPVLHMTFAPVLGSCWGGEAAKGSCAQLLQA